MYSPKIKPEYVRKLYKLKHSFSKPIPMTQMVNTAVREYLVNQGVDCNESNTDWTTNYENFRKDPEVIKSRIPCNS